MADSNVVTSKRQSLIVAIIAVSISILSSVAATSATLARFDERLANDIVNSERERRALQIRVDQVERLCSENSLRGVEIKKDLEYIKLQLVDVQKELKGR